MSKHIIIIHKVINMFYNNDLLPQLLVDAWSYDDNKKIDFIYYMILQACFRKILKALHYFYA